MPTAIVGTERARNWKRLQFPKVTVQYGDPIRFEQVEEPTREQSQAAADVVFAEIKKLHGALREADGRKKAIAAARQRAAPRQAAEAATRSAGSSALKLSQSCPGMISAPGVRSR